MRTIENLKAYRPGLRLAHVTIGLNAAGAVVSRGGLDKALLERSRITATASTRTVKIDFPIQAACRARTAVIRPVAATVDRAGRAVRFVSTTRSSVTVQAREGTGTPTTAFSFSLLLAFLDSGPKSRWNPRTERFDVKVHQPGAVLLGFSRGGAGGRVPIGDVRKLKDGSDGYRQVSAGTFRYGLKAPYWGGSDLQAISAQPAWNGATLRAGRALATTKGTFTMRTQSMSGGRAVNANATLQSWVVSTPLRNSLWDLTAAAALRTPQTGQVLFNVNVSGLGGSSPALAAHDQADNHLVESVTDQGGGVTRIKLKGVAAGSFGVRIFGWFASDASNVAIHTPGQVAAPPYGPEGDRDGISLRASRSTSGSPNGAAATVSAGIWLIASFGRTWY